MSLSARHAASVSHPRQQITDKHTVCPHNTHCSTNRPSTNDTTLQVERMAVGGANLVFEVEAASIEDGPEIIHLDADTMPVYSEPDTAFLEL